jgi:hypothetical protein
MIYIGIDPGLEGAIAVLSDGKQPFVYPMPILESKGKREIEFAEVRKILLPYVVLDTIVAIERQIPIGSKREKVTIAATGQQAEVSISRGIASTGYFMENTGTLRGICIGLDLKHIRVLPQVWKSTVLTGLSWHGNKIASVLYVQGVYPMLDLRRTPKCRKPSDGFADAVCIAEYARWKHGTF